jgi:serine/threonine protein kinase
VCGGVWVCVCVCVCVSFKLSYVPPPPVNCHTHKGQCFIVTELASLGSLRDVLRDKQRSLSWSTCERIALQMAAGLAHLHAIPMVHRDLKSANVLMTEDRRNGELAAKVADFGASKRLRPRPSVTVTCSFTGAVKVVSDHSQDHISPADKLSNGASGGSGAVVDAGTMGSPPIRAGRAVSALDTLSVEVLDVNGTMTRAVGTLLWMAPEMFRGDQNYGPEVDVYSFGIILWEVRHDACS